MSFKRTLSDTETQAEINEPTPKVFRGDQPQLAITDDDLEKMTVAELKALATQLETIQKKIEELIWRNETCPQLVSDIKKKIEKYGVSIHENEPILTEIRQNHLFDVHEFRVKIEITANSDEDYHPDVETAKFSRYWDYDFYQKYRNQLPDEIDFDVVYQGEDLNWKHDGTIHTTAYVVDMYAVTKKFDLEALSPSQDPVECFILRDNTQDWIHDCTIVRLECGDFKIVTKDKEMYKTLDDLWGLCYEKKPVF